MTQRNPDHTRRDERTGRTTATRPSPIGRLAAAGRAIADPGPSTDLLSTMATVLLYHDVNASPRPGDEAWNVSPDAFAGHVAALADRRASSLPVAEVADRLRAHRPFPPGAFAVTFDDGFVGQAAAATRLAEAGIASTVYVTAGFVGRPGYLDRHGLHDLAQVPGVTIGAHGTTHEHLDVLDGPAMRHEIDHSRDALEHHVGRRVEAFAYPHGSVDRHVRAHLAGGGWHSGAGVKNARTHEHDDPLAFARVTVRPGCSTEQVLQLVDGDGVPIAWTRERVRTTAFRQFRRLRRRMRR